LLIRPGYGHDTCHGPVCADVRGVVTRRHFWARAPGGGLGVLAGASPGDADRPQEQTMDLVGTLQELVGQVPALVRPLIVALAGAIPYVEGEGGAALGIVSGIHPVVAAVAAAAGNFLVVAGLVLLGSGARRAVVARRRAGSVAVA